VVAEAAPALLENHLDDRHEHEMNGSRNDSSRDPITAYTSTIAKTSMSFSWLNRRARLFDLPPRSGPLDV
jgi:hypothetical protein